MKHGVSWLLVGAALAVAACGGGGVGGTGAPEAPADARGTLREPPVVVAGWTTRELDALATARGIADLARAARCDVRLAALDYVTPGVRGEASNVSAALLLPAGACAGQAHPLLAFGRSTEVHRPRTLANAQDPDTQMLAVLYAAQGHAVVAPDYLGFAKSGHAFHPYLHAPSEATTLIDALRAARRAAPLLDAALSGRLLLAGYSQGAHASMAAQRAIEASHAAELPLAAAAHLAGPYNLSALLERGDAIVGYQYFVPFLLTSWQAIEGNLYAQPAEAFKAPYASYIAGLLPHATHTFVSLREQQLLPGSEVSPAQARALLMQPAYLARVQSDAAHPLIAAARRNDLASGWAPRAPTLLCGGAADPTVSPALHQVPAMGEFERRGAPAVTSVDVDATIQARHGPGGRAPADPGSADYANYFSAYHTHLAPPLCHAAARDHFERVR